ncbi:MAG: pectinesterase family protein [Treponema sp.]|nr:pectinesterase family protein [Treponema sp.]
MIRKTIISVLCILLLFTACCREQMDITETAPDNIYPAPGAVNAYPEGEIMIVFDNEPVLTENQYIYIYEKGISEPVDTIRIWTKKTGYTSNEQEDKGETQTFGETILNVGFTRTWVRDKTLYIIPRHGILQYNKTYSVVIPKEAIADAYFNEKEFTGFAGEEWSFKTRAAPFGLSAAKPITVNASRCAANNADFRTVWGALNFVRTAPAGNYTIDVAPGVYNEIFHYIGPAQNNITINGTGNMKYGADVVLQGFNHAFLNPGSGNTHRRNAFYFSGPDNITLKNITFKNLDEHTGSQAEVLHFANASAQFRAVYNCGFYGHQDTVLTSGRVWFYKCYIEGDTDYIWGSSSAALFEECEIVSINHNSGYIFVARLALGETVGKGYVALNSSLRSNRSGNFFGRTLPASTGSYCQAAVINSTISGSFMPSLWNVSHKSFLGNGEHVGFKVYNLKTPNGDSYNTSGRHNRTSLMSDELYYSEYNGRNAILNRIYVIETGMYKDAPIQINLSSYEKKFNATPDESRAK